MPARTSSCTSTSVRGGETACHLEHTPAACRQAGRSALPASAAQGHLAQSANVRSSAIFKPFSSMTALSWLMRSLMQRRNVSATSRLNWSAVPWPRKPGPDSSTAGASCTAQQGEHASRVCELPKHDADAAPTSLTPPYLPSPRPHLPTPVPSLIRRTLVKSPASLSQSEGASWGLPAAPLSSSCQAKPAPNGPTTSSSKPRAASGMPPTARAVAAA